MVYKINRRSICNIGLFLLMIFMFSVDFRLSIFKSTGVAYAFAAVTIALIWYGARIRPIFKVPAFLALWLISFVFVISSMDASCMIKYLIGLILMFVFYYNDYAHVHTIKLLAVVGFIFTFATFFFYFFPQIYNVIIVPYLADYLQQTALTMMKTSRYPGLTGHYSTNGTYLAIGLGALFALYIARGKDNKYKFQWIGLVPPVLSVGALLLVGKRAHLVFSIVAMFAVYWVVNSDRKQSRIFKFLRLALVLVVVFAIAVNQLPILSNTFNRFIETAKRGTFLMSRGGFYTEAWATFKAHPIIGIGWKTMIGIIDHDVHNIYIQLLAENGILGFTFFAFLIITGVVISTRLLAIYVKKNIYRATIAPLVFATYYIYFFAMYGFTGNPLYDEQPFYIYMIAYGILIYYMKLNKNEIGRKKNGLHIDISTGA